MLIVTYIFQIIDKGNIFFFFLEQVKLSNFVMLQSKCMSYLGQTFMGIGLGMQMMDLSMTYIFWKCLHRFLAKCLILFIQSSNASYFDQVYVNDL